MRISTTSARRALDIPVWVHENDVPLTRHPHQYARERSPVRYMAAQVQAMPIVASLLRSGAFLACSDRRGGPFSDGDLDVSARSAIARSSSRTARP